MKRWAVVAIALYAVFLSLLAFPMYVFLRQKDNPSEIIGIFYAFVAPGLVLAQAALLMIPLAAVQERPIKRRSILVSAIFGGILMAAMTVSFVSFVLLMFLGENTAWDHSAAAFYTVFGISWLGWGTLFWKSYSNNNPTALTTTMTQWLLRGSILELLIAVPSHIISRRRDECCAPPITLVGIAMGLSVAVLSFGPGVFFLFAKRIRAKRRMAG